MIALNFGAAAPEGVGYSQIILQSLANFTSTDSPSALQLDYVLTNQNSPLVPQIINVTTGNNAINSTTSPQLPLAGGVWIVGPVGNGTTMTIKGVNGDTGIVIHPSCPFFWAFDSTAPTSFVISVASGITGVRLLWV